MALAEDGVDCEGGLESVGVAGAWVFAGLGGCAGEETGEGGGGGGGEGGVAEGAEAVVVG